VSEPTCRTCYLRSLPHDEMVRIAAEPITMPVYYCPEHQQRANEIESMFAKMVAEGKVIWQGSMTGRFPREPQPQFGRITYAQLAHSSEVDITSVGSMEHETLYLLNEDGTTTPVRARDVEAENRWEGEGGR
jgi:hypothetical protein